MTEERKPKIIIDEDWKSQVQAEKEAAEKARTAPQPEDDASEATDETPQAKSEPASETDPPLPPASFPMLVQTLAMQAMASLGIFPDPIENKPVVRLNHAKHAIDSLGILEDKTKGNLTADETRLLSETLHQLRMAYVGAKSKPSPNTGSS